MALPEQRTSCCIRKAITLPHFPYGTVQKYLCKGLAKGLRHFASALLPRSIRDMVRVKSVREVT